MNLSSRRYLLKSKKSTIMSITLKLFILIQINLEGKKINESLENDISFLIHIRPNYPFKPPRVYCLSHVIIIVFKQFCEPSIADGRDLFQDIMDFKWNINYSILDIVGKIPLFLVCFIDKLKEGILILNGNYYLGEVYDIEILKNLPVCRQNLIISF